MRILLLAFMVVSYSFTFAQYSKVQTSSDKNTFFLYYGYNRTVYSKSNIQFTGQGYDFTMSGATAQDNPAAFTQDNYFGSRAFTASQFNLRAGYYYKKGWAISGGVDHFKYVFNDNNQVELSGNVDQGTDTVTNLSGEYSGEEFQSNRKTFHYVNRINYLRLDLSRSFELFAAGRKRSFVITGHLGGGFGALISDNDFNFAGKHSRSTVAFSGFGITASSGLRFEFFRHLFIQTNLNGGLQKQTRLGTRGSDPYSYAKQAYGYAEWNAVIGFLFHIKGKKDCDCPKW
jgi:hypothetical protein